MTTVHVVTCESEGGGICEWHQNPQDAEKQFERYCKEPALLDHTIIQFDLSLDTIDMAEITRMTDEAMWHMAYKPNAVRIGTDGYLKKALQALA